MMCTRRKKGGGGEIAVEQRIKKGGAQGYLAGLPGK